MFLKFDPYRVWCPIFYSKLVNCILFKIIVQHVRFVKSRGTCGSGERNVKIWIDFRKSPRFSLTSPLSQEREKSSRPVFTMCVSPGITKPQPLFPINYLLVTVICECFFCWIPDKIFWVGLITSTQKSLMDGSLHQKAT